MSISQERMISVIQAGTKFEQAFTRLRKDFEALIEQQTPITRAQLEDIYWNNEQAIKDVEMERAVLHIEREHFRRNAGRNRYVRELAERKRRESGIPTRKVATRQTFDAIEEKFGLSSIGKEPEQKGKYRGIERYTDNWTDADEAKWGKKPAPTNRPLKDEEGNLIHYDDATPAELAAIEAELERQEQESEGQGLGLEQG